MKVKKMIEVQALDYTEQQYMLSMFPDAFWVVVDNRIKFYLPLSMFDEVNKAVNDYKAVRKTYFRERKEK